jgi:MFS transporter, Spinster family, sphingosine-1-phosphate transporter
MHRSSSDSAVDTSPRSSIIPTIGGKYFALGVLFAMNLLNYIDRYSFFAVGKQIKHDLGIDDKWFGVLGVSFMVVYTVISPLMGWLGDRYNRRMLLAGGVGLWSLATVGTAFSTDFYHMFFWRALLGVGEASYGVIAPALLADLFSVEKRGRAMGIYYLALPIGTALGFIIAGRVASDLGWPAVFFVVGLPGLLAAFAGLTILDPGRGASEGKTYTAKAQRPRLRDYAELFKTRTFVYNTLGMAAATFATGAYAAWGSIFYQRVRGMSLKEANDSLGILLAIAGLVGIALSTLLVDVLRKYTRRAYLLLPAAVVIASVPMGIAAILDPERVSSLSFLFVASVLMAMVLGPSNTVTANVVPANRRAAGYALFIFLIHLLGDISSPLLLGWISNVFGSSWVVNSGLGSFLVSIGAGPTAEESGQMTNLTVAMLVVGPVLLLGGILFLIGSRHLAKDMDRVAAQGEPPSDAPAFPH